MLSKKALGIVVLTAVLMAQWVGQTHTLMTPFNARAEDIEDVTDADFFEDVAMPVVPDISVSYIVQDGNKVSVQFDSQLEDGYFYHLSIYRKESDDNYSSYADVAFTDRTTDFSYVFDFWDNGEYKVYLRAKGYLEWYNDFVIDSINTDVVVNDEFVDNKAPVITLDVSDVTGLQSGDVFTFKVYTDEPCMINIGMDTFLNTSEVEYSAYFNADFSIVATDSWSNTSTALVQVRAFGDGSLPNGDVLDDNENPLNKDNKDTFWEDAAAGKLTNGGGSSDGGNSSSSIDKLPQTGVMDRLLDSLKFIIPLAVAGIGVLIMKKNKSGKEGSANE